MFNSDLPQSRKGALEVYPELAGIPSSLNLARCLGPTSSMKREKLHPSGGRCSISGLLAIGGLTLYDLVR
jgi:hypothetical protein